VHAIGLNRAEIMFRSGQYLVEPRLPSKLGYEASGVVEAVGEGVDRALIGKKFSTVPTFPADKYGVYGEVAIVPAVDIAAYPDNLSFEEGTSIWMQYLTAYGALVHLGKVSAGDFVLITAASSSVGIAAIEIVRAQGASSIAVTRTSKKKGALLDVGADHVIVSDEEDLPARVASITGGKGARLVFDPVLGKSLEGLAQATSNGGIIFAYGMLAQEPTPFPLGLALSKSLRVWGYVMPALLAQPGVRGPAQEYVFEHLRSGAFKPRIARTFPLSQIVEAHRYMESNEQIGKVVVVTGA
jgi:NADPH:quinone reductase-like Zn-dependent oxidoreductase